jgi:formate/nitrite transporter FocA (FNT family)
MAFPKLRIDAVIVGGHPAHLGATREAFASAILAGAAITLLTWMEHSTESIPAKLLAAWSIAFVLAAAPLQHVIVVSIEIFAGLHAGAPYGYGDWVGTFAWAALGNIIGGVGLVTALRLMQAIPANDGR